MQWCICHYIHRNNVAFTEHTRKKITTATLTQFNNDISLYVIYIKDDFHMISSSTQNDVDHNGLITYILCQLKLSNVSLFQD
jgi:hypothetical protein